MHRQAMTDQTARLLREAWFQYLDSIAPIRPSLYRYCRRITRNLWDAEDLLQETLLKGFGAIGRGDFCRDSCRVSNHRTYLFRIATNLWIDQVRHREVQSIHSDATEQPPRGPNQSIAIRDAAWILMTRASPQESAAVLLKDVFDFTLDEIALILTTTIGAVKSALHRGRVQLEEKQPTTAAGSRTPSKELLDRFCAAFNARDVQGVVSLLLDNTTYEVPGVGGERGKKDLIWVNVPKPDDVRAEPVLYQGEWMVAFWRGPERGLACVDRFEEQDGQIARVITYYYCPETIRECAAGLGVPAVSQGVSEGRYHQAPEVLSTMIAGAVLPWNSSQASEEQGD
jgi:RNA polymerase sigma-70 factor, ECF subfamily